MAWCQLGIRPLFKQWWPQFLNFYNIFISWWNSVIPGTLIKTATEFNDIIAVASADANGVLNGILEALEGLHLSQDEIESKLIGCTFDGSRVNQGAKGGVIAKLNNLIPHVLVSLWCAPYELELSLLNAAKEKDHGAIITTVEKAVDPIYRFYYASPKLGSQEAQGTKRHCRNHRRISRILRRAQRDAVDGIASPRQQSAPTPLPCNDNASWRSFPQENWGGQQVCCIPKVTKIQEIHRWNFIPLGRSLCLGGALSFQKEDLLVTDVVIKLTEASQKLTQMKTLKGKYSQRFKVAFQVHSMRNPGRAFCSLELHIMWWECAECLPGVNKSAHDKEIWAYEADPFPWVWDFWLQKQSSLRCEPCCLWVGWAGGTYQFLQLCPYRGRTNSPPTHTHTHHPHPHPTTQWMAHFFAWRHGSVPRQLMKSSQICLAATQRISVTCWFLSESWLHYLHLAPP